MHPNQAFRGADKAQNLKFAKARGFGVLALNGTDAPMLSHVPFFIEDGVGWLHLVRSNPIVRAYSAPTRAKIAVSGPDSYISPDWYKAADQVPTWNYVAVHLTGTLTQLPGEALRDLIDRESAVFEAQLAPKSPWTSAKMDPDALDKMMRMIVPFRFDIEQVEGTWKLNQNKPDAVRLRAADAVAADGIGSELAALAAMMRDA